MSAPVAEAVQALVTVRDWLRWGVSRFRSEGLVFGHGTANALDEAAYLILYALHLPIDELDPWLDARLTPAERLRMAELFENRIATRKPASYLTGEAWMQGFRFAVDERAIVPRSFIGELLIGGPISGLTKGVDKVRAILDIGTGSGCLAVLAAQVFPNAVIDAVDTSADALAVAARNVADYALAERVRLVQCDLFAALGDKRYDLIVANPPYVSAAAMRAFPPEYRHEPAEAHAGGEDGLDIVRRILAEAPSHLTPDGWLVVEVGGGRRLLEAGFPALPFLWLETPGNDGEVFALAASAFEPHQAAAPGPEKRDGLAARVRGLRQS